MPPHLQQGPFRDLASVPYTRIHIVDRWPASGLIIGGRGTPLQGVRLSSATNLSYTTLLFTIQYLFSNHSLAQYPPMPCLSLLVQQVKREAAFQAPPLVRRRMDLEDLEEHSYSLVVLYMIVVCVTAALFFVSRQRTCLSVTASRTMPSCFPPAYTPALAQCNYKYQISTLLLLYLTVLVYSSIVVYLVCRNQHDDITKRYMSVRQCTTNDKTEN